MSAPTPEPGLLAAWAGLVRRRWRVGAAVFAVVAAAGLALLLLTRPIHRAEAALRLGEPPPPGGVSPSAGVFSFFQLGGDPFANDLELLASRSLAERVALDNALNVRVRAPRGWHRDSLLASLEAEPSASPATWEVRWEEDGGVRARRVRSEAGDDGDGGEVPVVRGPAREPLRLGGLAASFRPWREGMPREVGLSVRSLGEATRSLRSSLSVERPRREANVVSLAYDHPDPAVALGVVESVVEEFVRLRTSLQHRESGETSDSLRSVARRTADELLRAEEALEVLQREGRVVAPAVQSEALVQRQADLQGRLERARSEVAAVDETLRRLDRADDGPRSWTALLSYPVFLENETLGGLLARLTELHAEREALAARRTPSNRDVRVLDDQIAYLEASLRDVAREYRAGLVEQIVSLEPRLAALDSVLAELPARAVELGRRERDVRLLSEVLVLTEQRLRQEELRDALTYSNIQVVDPPALRDRPVWPRKKLGGAVVLLVAGGCGLLGMVVRERTDPGLRTAEQVEALLGAPVLAWVEPGDGGTLAFTGPQAETVLGRAAGSNGAGRLTLVGVGGAETARAAARGLEAASGNGGAGGRMHAVGPVGGAAEAREVADAGAPAALVVDVGRTTVGELRRAAELLTRAGGRVAGAILVLPPSGRAGPPWR